MVRPGWVLEMYSCARACLRPVARAVWAVVCNPASVNIKSKQDRILLNSKTRALVQPCCSRSHSKKLSGGSTGGSVHFSCQATQPLSGHRKQGRLELELCFEHSLPGREELLLQPQGATA